MEIVCNVFEKNFNNNEIKQITIKNKFGIQISLINYGARILSLLLPDSEKVLEEVVVGPKKINELLQDKYYRGATVGRFANRIDKGRFSLDENHYQLNCIDGKYHLHGGHKGFDQAIWDFQIFEDEQRAGVEFSYISADGEEGYPGNLQTKVTFILDEQNNFEIKYKAITDKKTVLNLTNHVYWNLGGEFVSDSNNQYLKINSDQILDVNENKIPNGNYIHIDQTPWDFREFKQIKSEVKLLKEKLYDQCYFFSKSETNIESVKAILWNENKSRGFEMTTSKPCMQLYTGGKGVCLETQYAPNSMNIKNFMSPVLNVGDEYQQYTKFKFIFS